MKRDDEIIDCYHVLGCRPVNKNTVEFLTSKVILRFDNINLGLIYFHYCPICGHKLEVKDEKET